MSNQHQPTILFMFFTTNSSDQLFCSYFSQPIQATNSFVYACTNQFHQPTLISPITSFFLTTTCLSNSTTTSANRFPLPNHNQFSQLIFLHNRFANQQPPQPNNFIFHLIPFSCLLSPPCHFFGKTFRFIFTAKS